MKYFRFTLPPALLLLAACAGGNLTSGPLPRSASSSLGSMSQAHALTEAQSDAALRPEPLYAPGTNDLLYVGNVGSNSITVYHHNVDGKAAPLYIIAGSNTGITAPGQLSEDSQGNLYVVNAPNKILVFAKGARGNIKPQRILNVALPPPVDPGLLIQISAMTVDQVTGKIYVAATTGPEGAYATLYRFPPDASGNEAPFASGSIHYWPAQLANDSTGNNLIYKNGPMCCSAATAGVETVAKQFYPGASPASVYGVGAFSGYGVADDPASKTYLVTGSAETSLVPPSFGTEAGIFRLAEKSTGTFADAELGESYAVTPAPISIITSDTCGGQLALGYLRNIYVVNSVSNGCPTDAVYVYAHDSSGNVSPLRVLSGLATKLNNPFGIYEGQ